MKPKHALLLVVAIVGLTDVLLDPHGGTSVLDGVRHQAEIKAQADPENGERDEPTPSSERDTLQN